MTINKRNDWLLDGHGGNVVAVVLTGVELRLDLLEGLERVLHILHRMGGCTDDPEDDHVTITPTYTPNEDTGDFVIVTNCKNAVFTGHKLDQKVYRHHSGYIGGMKEIVAKDMMSNTPEKAMFLAIKGMLPHNKLGRQMIKKLRVYAGSEHEQAAQKPEVWEVK